MPNPRSPHRLMLEALLPEARRRGWTMTELARQAGTTKVRAGSIIQQLRADAAARGEPDPWPTDDAQRREATYLKELIKNAGVSPRNVQDTNLRYLRQLDRKDNGLEFRGFDAMTLENFRQRLLDEGMVIDLHREDGDGYKRGDVFVRPARAGEWGRIIAGRDGGGTA